MFQKLQNQLLTPKDTVIRVYALENATASSVAQTIASVDPAIRVAPDVRGNALIVAGAEVNLTRIGKLIAKLDQGSQDTPNVIMLKVQYRRVKDVIPLIKAVVGDKTRVAVDDASRSIVLQGSPRDLEAAGKLLATVDTPQPRKRAVQLSFFFVKSGSGTRDDLSANVLQTWKKLHTTTIKDMTAVCGTAAQRKTLKEAIEFFRDQGLNVFPHWPSIGEKGMTPDEEVNYDMLAGLKDLSLKAVLQVLVKTLGPEINYGIDNNGIIVISSREQLSEEDLAVTGGEEIPEGLREPPKLPTFLTPAAEALARNGFDHPELMSSFMVKTETAGKFETQAASADEGNMLRLGIKGRAIPKEDPLSAHLEIDARIIMGKRLGEKPQQAVNFIDIFNVKSAVEAPYGDYIVLAAAPTDPDIGKAIAMIIRADMADQPKSETTKSGSRKPSR